MAARDRARSHLSTLLSITHQEGDSFLQPGAYLFQFLSTLSNTSEYATEPIWLTLPPLRGPEKSHDGT